MFAGIGSFILSVVGIAVFVLPIAFVAAVFLGIVTEWINDRA